MYLSPKVRSLFALLSVWLLCSALGLARTTRKATHKRAATAAKTHSASSRRAGKSTSSKRGKHARVKTAHSRGQQAIDGERAREIQQALIRAHYLEGEPSGVWDQRTRDAMTRLQQDNGWQTKVIPDSRALIKLGLGPKHAGLLNPPPPTNASLDSMAADPESGRGDMQPGGGVPTP